LTVLYLFFFFQAEDGIRDKLVTGVQTCALPIWSAGLRFVDPAHPYERSRSCIIREPFAWHLSHPGATRGISHRDESADSAVRNRSEERRVGKECRSRLLISVLYNICEFCE